MAKALGPTNSNKEHQVVVSPLFEGDIGPPSPLHSWNSTITTNVTNSLHDSLNQSKRLIDDLNEALKEAEIKNKVKEEENRRLIEALGTIRKEIEANKGQTSTSQVETKRGGGEFNLIEKNQAEITRAIFEERTNLLEQVEKLRSYTKTLQQCVDGVHPKNSRDAEISTLRELCETLSEHLNDARARMLQVAKLVVPLQNVDHDYHKTEIEQTINKQQVKKLERKLEETKRDLERLLKERDRLFELSNQQKAELNKRNIDPPMEEIVRITEKQVSERFQNKIQSVENALEQLLLQNRSLKSQLEMKSSYGYIDEEDPPSPPIISSQRVQKTKKTKKNGIGVTKKKPTTMEQRRNSKQESSSHDLAAEIRLRRVERQEAKSFPYETTTQRSPSSSLGNGAFNARERLAKAKEQLGLTGTKSSKLSKTTSKAPSAMSKRRTDLVAERRKVRNYNIVD